MPSNPSVDLSLSHPNRAEPAKIWKARSYIQEHLEEQLSLEVVAKSVQMSPNHLSETFKQVTGVNFVEYIARRRFAKACLFLLEPNLRVSDIAFEVGFQSLSQFNRVFKKFYGHSPTEFRVRECNGTRPSPYDCDHIREAKTLAVEMRSRSALISDKLRPREAINGHAVAPKQS